MAPVFHTAVLKSKLSFATIAWLFLFLLYFKRYFRDAWSRLTTRRIFVSQFPSLYTAGLGRKARSNHFKRYRKLATQAVRQFWHSKKKLAEHTTVPRTPSQLWWEPGSRPFSEPPILDYSAFDEGGHLYKRLHRTKDERGSRLEESVKKDDFLIEIYLQKMYIGWVGEMRDAQAEIEEELEERRAEMRKRAEAGWVPVVLPRVEAAEMSSPGARFQEADMQNFEADLVECKKRNDFLSNLEEDLAFEYETVADEQSDYCRKTSFVPRRRFPQSRKPEWEPEVINHIQPVRPRPVWEAPCLNYSEFDEDGEVWKAIERRKKNSTDVVQATKTQDVLTEHHLLVKYIEWTQKERDTEAYHGVEWREDFFVDLENELWIDQQEVLAECLVDQEQRMKTLAETPAQDPALIQRFAATAEKANAATRRAFLQAEGTVWDLDGGERSADEDDDPPEDAQKLNRWLEKRQIRDAEREGERQRRLQEPASTWRGGEAEVDRARGRTITEEQTAEALKLEAEAEAEAHQAEADRWQIEIQINHDIALAAAETRTSDHTYELNDSDISSMEDDKDEDDIEFIEDDENCETSSAEDLSWRPSLSMPGAFPENG